jgi:hypothetical protein
MSLLLRARPEGDAASFYTWHVATTQSVVSLSLHEVNAGSAAIIVVDADEPRPRFLPRRERSGEAAVLTPGDGQGQGNQVL